MAVIRSPQPRSTTVSAMEGAITAMESISSGREIGAPERSSVGFSAGAASEGTSDAVSEEAAAEEVPEPAGVPQAARLSARAPAVRRAIHFFMGKSSFFKNSKQKPRFPAGKRGAASKPPRARAGTD